MLKKMMPPNYLLVALLIMIAVHFIVPINNFLKLPWTLTGLLPLAFGVWLNLNTDRAFKRRKTTVKPFESSNALITNGAFNISRHPMYLGFVLVLIGVALLLGSLSPTLVVIAFAFLMDFLFIRKEEEMLDDQFQEDWKQYTSRVRRWL